MSTMGAMFGVVPLAWGALFTLSTRYSWGGTMSVKFSDLQLTFEFVSSGGMGENDAYLDRQSGKIYWHSEFGDNDEELPHDNGDEKYISIPDKRELDLGKSLGLDFAREFLPDDYDEVRQFFSRRGAYRRYKDLLVRRAPSNGGTIFRTRPRKQLCGIGARRTGSTSVGPEVTLLLSAGGVHERTVQVLAPSCTDPSQKGRSCAA